MYRGGSAIHTLGDRSGPICYTETSAYYFNNTLSGFHGTNYLQNKMSDITCSQGESKTQVLPPFSHTSFIRAGLPSCTDPAGAGWGLEPSENSVFLSLEGPRLPQSACGAGTPLEKTEPWSDMNFVTSSLNSQSQSSFDYLLVLPSNIMIFNQVWKIKVLK